MDTTRATAHLPYLDVEIRHRKSDDEDAEYLSLTLKATPSLDAFGRHVAQPEVFAALMQMHPMTWWWRGAQAMMQPWLAMNRALLPAPGREDKD
ncbi:hypothetical protein [Marinivivus vitaminiproducens]|uniref:hypothetical protein n=1 Tax=Marinivivus vitaminiproducens TaxID=3035935 RepID=UPI002798ABE4|nr:hypothetical protein P4R82_05155 [Geminicoccaceae bacterium SCSIO 64248]